jgi:hypothetical protein
MIADNAVFFNSEEFGESATINPANLLPRTATIIRGAMNQLVTIDPGLGTTDVFLIKKADYPQPEPNDEITIDDTVYVVQTGFSYDPHAQVWTVPVMANGRVRS